jgi:hypothetical protein
LAIFHIFVARLFLSEHRAKKETISGKKQYPKYRP